MIEYFVCVCGHKIKNERWEQIRCPECGRTYTLRKCKIFDTEGYELDRI